MAKILAFINMKGGVGKTTLAVNAAYTLAKIEKKKILLIDMDPQMNATQYTLSEDQVEEIINDRSKSVFGFLSSEYKVSATQKSYSSPSTVEKFIFPVEDVFDIIPSSLDIMKLNLTESPFKLRQYITENLNSKYDIIILDCPPTISAYTKISLLAADMYLVPMKADSLSLFGLPMLQSYISDTIEGEFEHKIEFVGIILNMVNSSRLLYKKIKPQILKEWKTKLFTNEIFQRECIIKGLDGSFETKKYIIDMDDPILVDQMKNVTKEILQKGRI